MRAPNRREFIAASSASVLAAGRLARGQEPAPKQSSANDAITLGFIGVGGMGSGLLDIFRKMPDVRVAAVCDVDESHRGKAKETAGEKTDSCADFRRVLDRKDIDAVVVATPDHWHAIPTILACQAEKDVYCEKPLAFRIGEGRAVADAAVKHKRVTQMGNLIHAGDNYRRVVEIVRSGVLGPIFKANVWMTTHRQRLGKPADSAPPPGLDYDTWLGPAPKRTYNPNRSHFTWRYFWDYGGGVLCDFVCHIVDLVHWAMDVDAPSTIAATGGRFVSDDNGETPDTLEVIYHYPKPNGPGFTMVWTQTDRSSYAHEGKHLGIMFQGTRGTLVSDYNSHKLFAEGDRTIEVPPPSIPKSVGHHREWLDAIKSRGPTSCNFEYGHRLSSVGHLGNIALWTGETLSWDRKAERVTNHTEANRYLWRDEYRAPWSIPKV
jgi:predicted dehydrogenase